MVRYWKDEEQTKAMTQIDEEDGQVWMCTGDKAVMDEEGYVQSERGTYTFIDLSGARLTPIGISQPYSCWEVEGNVEVTR